MRHPLRHSFHRFSSSRRSFWSAACGAIVWCWLCGEGSAEDILFSRDVLPILSENCFSCHGPDDAHRKGDLRLDLHEAALNVISVTDVEQSPLLQRVTSSEPDLIMPPASNQRLTGAQVDVLRRWIQQGATWGQLWSFQPLQKPTVPAPGFAEYPPGNEIDGFVRRTLQVRGLTPAPEADRRTLIRRATLDLTGVPPTPEDVQAFVADQRSDAWERLIDRLLQSPQYGERMAWDWLDAARYADSNGYQGDSERTMWPWRDWVVRSFNDNQPFDQFTVWQLAGDLLPESTPDQQLATGFCRNHMINGEGGRIAAENRVDYVMDMTETMGTVWMGLTLNCCRCHDHKFDPLSQKNYYELFAFFNQTPVEGGGRDPQTPPVLPVPSESQRQQLLGIAEQLQAVGRQLQDQSERDRLQKSENELRKAIPKVMVMADRSERRPTFILDRGLYNQPTDREVTASLPASLPPLQGLTESERMSLNRLHLARWLVSPQHPLTARVTVNRFWQQLFGIGLVRTAEDFGVQGEYPEHPELLDWLASDFRDSGWNVKRLLKTILSSHTYRQSSHIRETLVTDESGRRLTLAEVDPENRLLARGARFRLPAWMLRDQALAISGLLNRQLGGPPVNTYQPEGVWEEATFGNKKYVQDQGDALYRRSLYVFWRRIIGPTMFFDNATRQTCTVKVQRTNTPLHALLTFNETTYVESARTLAQQLLEQPSGPSDADRLRAACERILCRPPSAEEQTVLLAGLEHSRTHFQQDAEAAAQLLHVGESPRNTQLSASDHAAWTALCLAMLNFDETLTRE